jgi:hypothetical protein
MLPNSVEWEGSKINISTIILIYLNGEYYSLLSATA